jgi:transglutaminase-like putative cysteine protease
MNLSEFLKEDRYVNHTDENIVLKAEELFKGINNDTEKAKVAYEYVRDEIPHSFDIEAKVITAKASDVLKYKTGICHAKANLLAALLRSQGIPVGFCFQHITLADDDSLGYCVHAYNAVYVENKWIKLDARGNKEGVNARFSLGEPILAFPIRSEYDEYFWKGIYASPHVDTMKMLEHAKTIQDVIDNLPDYVNELPDIEE